MERQQSLGVATFTDTLVPKDTYLGQCIGPLASYTHTHTLTAHAQRRLQTFWLNCVQNKTYNCSTNHKQKFAKKLEREKIGERRLSEKVLRLFPVGDC